MALFIDMHCHPTLKHYLFGYSVFREPFGRKDNDYANIAVTQPAMVQGDVQVVMAAHHLPEKNILTDWRLVHFSLPLFGLFINKYIEKVEKGDPFQQTLDMIDDFEQLFAGHTEAVVAHNMAELQLALQGNKKIFIHTIEGGHSLGRGKNNDEYAGRMEQLKQKGVAMLTLSHFYPNDITSPVEGIPPNTKKILGMDYTPPSGAPLSAAGQAIVRQLLDKGILIDLTHTNPQARKEVFEINQARGAGARPIVFSHVGVRALFNDTHHPEFALMAPDDSEIRAIQACNGVIGIIFMNYWLTGKDERFLSGRDYGLDYVINSIRYIRELTGSFDHIAIGTDFDGMTDPPDDCYQTSMLGEFSNRFLQVIGEMGGTAADAEKITGGNVLRVLKDGWGS